MLIKRAARTGPGARRTPVPGSGPVPDAPPGLRSARPMPYPDAPGTSSFVSGVISGSLSRRYRSQKSDST